MTKLVPMIFISFGIGLLFDIAHSPGTEVSHVDIIGDQAVIEFYIGLHQNNIDKLEAIVRDISDPRSLNYGNYLSQEEINGIVNPTEEQRQHVVEWLGNSRITIKNDYGDTLMCRCRLVNFMVLMNTKVKSFYRDGKGGNIFVIPENFAIPDNMRNVIDIITDIKLVSSESKKYDYLFEGDEVISNRILMHRRDIPAHVDKGVVTREVFQRIYNIPDVVLDHTTTVAAAGYMGGIGFSSQDLGTFQMINGLKLNNKTTVINKMTGVDDESTLDMQMIGTVAAGASLWFDASPHWLYGWSVNFYNLTDIPDVISISYGWNENDQCEWNDCGNESSQEYVLRTNNELLKITARGVTILVASGDAGSPGRTNEGCSSTTNPMRPVFPGSSPWVLSVGATFLVAGNETFDYKTPICKKFACANGTVEQGVSLPDVGWTSGAGFTMWEQRPWWQEAAVEGYFREMEHKLPEQQYWNRNGRGYPDVAALGHNCIDYSGIYWNVDGTSCSSPVFAGIVATLNDYQTSRGKPKLGFVNPLLYQMWADTPKTFNDITMGNSSCTEGSCCGPNAGFTATKGWDPVSGLGTPNVGGMMDWLFYYT